MRCVVFGEGHWYQCCIIGVVANVGTLSDS
jgi:hypothetical protein